jgi:hypothetical protein
MGLAERGNSVAKAALKGEAMLRIVALLVSLTHLFLAADLGTEAPTSDQGSGWDPWG